MNMLNLFKKIINNYTKKSKNSFSLAKLKQAGLIIEPINSKVINKEFLINTSQFSTQAIPWIGLLKSGIYQIKFSPEIQSQINSGILNVTGGVARNESGQIIAHGSNINPLITFSPFILYQIGVVAFGAYHLQQINKSLKEINRKLGEIYNFQLDKRSSQINSHFQEFSHISKGIIEFSKLGNVTEVSNRINMIKHIRLMNLSNLLHLQKNLQDKQSKLNALKSSFSFTSKERFKNLSDSITHYGRDLIDYKHSLFLDIVCTKTEVFFSMCRCFEETEDRLSSQKNQVDFFKKQLSSFETSLNKKSSEMKGLFNKEQTLKQEKSNIEKSWKKVTEVITNFDKVCIDHIQSTKSMVQNKDNIIFLHKKDSIPKDKKSISNEDRYKKTA
ncbi:MAG: hypothetical protein OXM55_07455 [Bdellovibrionales bacterium]|nr:hypothetical protein [Bdellovibrionales bacterium]